MSGCNHDFEKDCHECAATHRAIAAAAAAAIHNGDRVMMRGDRSTTGTVNEVYGNYAYVSWDRGVTRKDPLSWLMRLDMHEAGR